jgi:hypothetical protein
MSDAAHRDTRHEVEIRFSLHVYQAASSGLPDRQLGKLAYLLQTRRHVPLFFLAKPGGIRLSSIFHCA